MTNPIVNLRRLCSGGKGDLFVGQRRDNGEILVVKYLREYWIPHAKRAFAREVHILRRGLPGLVRLLFADIGGEHPYYVMPYVNGGALTRYAGRLSDNQLQNVASELARTLLNLHSVFEAHGDVKPDNILVSHDGRLQVADPLGNGSVFTILFSGNRGGTPGYCAPEIRFFGGSISHVGDVYSYGATMYHLLTGRTPQDGQRLDPTAEGYMNAPKVREVIAACCQSTPNARPTMTEVLRILRGERWVDIQEERRQRQEFLKVSGVIAIGLIVGVALARGGAGLSCASSMVKDGKGLFTLDR